MIYLSKGSKYFLHLHLLMTSGTEYTLYKVMGGLQIKHHHKTVSEVLFHLKPPDQLQCPVLCLLGPY